jgi:ferritin-like metal-binding protein YciE
MATTTTKKPTPAAKTANKTKTATKAKTSVQSPDEFKEFFIDSLKDIYWAEKALSKALPKLQKAATSPDLAAAFEKHTAETKQHITTLEEVFAALGEKAQAKKCDAMQGLLEEADGIIEETEEGTMVRDAALIMAAQKVEHYEIATYGTLRVFANTLGESEVAEMLSATLENEKETDLALTTVAEGFVNEQAAAE